MKITIYELLGLIKDGKAPKKIKYYKNIYDYNQNDKRYHNIEPKRLDLSSKLGDYNFNYLNDEVEIIEEEQDIEELNLDTDELLKNVVITAQDYVIEGKINELIKEVNKLKNK